MIKRKKEKVVLLHRHGTAAPSGKASYIKFGEYKTRSEAVRAAKDYGLDGARYSPKSKVLKTNHEKLYYVKSKKKAVRRSQYGNI
jgi:hypothetical protein